MRTGLLVSAVLGVAFGSACPTRADDVIVGPGETLTLNADLVLTGNDMLLINGTVGQPCTVKGRGYSILTAGAWTGVIAVQYCRFQDLGTVSTPDSTGAPAFEVVASGNASVGIANSTFDHCNQFLVTTKGTASVVFQNNTVLANATFLIDSSPYISQPGFVADGNSNTAKLFQGNTILKGQLYFLSGNWLIGGDRDEDGNLLSGFRCGMESWADGNLAKNNYIHVNMTTDPDHYRYWTQITTIKGYYQEFAYNVTNTGAWIWRDIFGDFHHNLVVNVEAFNFVQSGNAKIHHNIFAHYYKPKGGNITQTATSFIEGYQPGDRFEVYNNVFDGSGDHRHSAAALFGLTIGADAWITSLRNNVFYNISWGGCIVGPAEGETWGQDRLGYADYNLFYVADNDAVNYGVTVPGKTVRVDAGFGLYDAHPGGPLDEKVDPMFRGPLPKHFPFHEDDILNRRVSVSDILDYYRNAYSPAAGSRLLGGADPQDGPGTNIGAS
jgi:hypothetical protein